MADVRHSFGTNRRLLSIEFFRRLQHEHALAILDAREREIGPRLERADHHMDRRLLRDKLRRIERIRADLNHRPVVQDAEPTVSSKI